MVRSYLEYLNEKTHGKVNRKKVPIQICRDEPVSSAYSRTENIRNLASGSRSRLGEETGFVWENTLLSCLAVT